MDHHGEMMASDTENVYHHFLPYLTTQQVLHLPEKEKAVIILPIASIEQHGPHLPIYTDSIIAEEVLRRTFELLPADFPAWRLPILPYGKSTEHADFAGTITLTSETLMRVLKEIGASIARSGFRRLVIINSHGGNSELIDVVIRDIREQFDLLVFGLHVFLRIAIPTEGLTEHQLLYDIHAGDVETSMLLNCHPELVKKDKAPESMPRHLLHQNTPYFGGVLNFAWLTRDISPSGVLGNPKTATPEKGEKYLSDAAAQLADLIVKIRDFKFDTWETL
jgi:creatinine amidohydrolase